MDKVTVEELLKTEDREGKEYVVEGIPSGMYADRASYGNRPILTFMLDNRLPCKATTFPYTTHVRRREGQPEPEFSLKVLLDREFISDNENLGIAAALVDAAIRRGNSIDVHGKYVDYILETDFVRIGNIGFRFAGYQFPGLKEY